MKRFKPLSLKKKRALAIAGVSVVCLTVVGTIAYNQDSMFFNNLFRLSSDTVEFVETFDSPDDWQPCQEIPKTAIARNKNDEPRYVRMKINEYWRIKNTQTPTTDHETSDLPLTWDDNGTTKHYAVINTQNDDKWELKSDGWYYYKTTLAKDEETLSLLKSVTLNCEVNTVGEIRYSAGGLVGESIPGDYAEANYHLYITFQVSDESMATRLRLYDQVASETKGINSDTTGNPIDYKANVAKTFDWLNGYNYYTTPEEGVFTYADSASYEHPIYYYRGKIRNNIIKFHNLCWRIVRTTETGGTKIIYDGAPEADGTCYEGDGGSHSVTIGSSRYNDVNIPGVGINVINAGYMYNDDYMDHRPDQCTNSTYSLNAALGCNVAASDDIKVADNYTYNNGVYTLSGNIAPFMGSGYSTYMRFTCFSTDANAQCTEAGFIAGFNTGKMYYLPMTNGDDAQAAINKVFMNKQDSLAKKAVDTWYANNMTNETDKFEDTVFCNDRGVASGIYGSTTQSMPVMMPIQFAAFSRITQGRPSLTCARPDDRFTVSDANGNGKLTYPVALLSTDEAMLAGTSNLWSAQAQESRTGKAVYYSGYYTGQNFWTMTPIDADCSATPICERPFIGFIGQGQQSIIDATDSVQSLDLRPVLSFKYDTFIASGSGTATDPYILEW